MATGDRAFVVESLSSQPDNFPVEHEDGRCASQEALRDRPKPLRRYQQLCVEEALRKNTIIHLDTGLGKTLVAVATIDEFLQRDRGKKACFIVPTSALVEQQIRCLREDSVFRDLRVRELVNASRASSELLESCDVLVGVHDNFRNAFVHGFLRPSQFSVAVFDECHSAIKGHPYVIIVKDFFSGCDPSPRIVGLTASFLHGVKDLVTAREQLEGNLAASIFAPEICGDEQALVRRQPSFRQVAVPPEPPHDCTQLRAVFEKLRGFCDCREQSIELDPLEHLLGTSGGWLRLLQMVRDAKHKLETRQIANNPRVDGLNSVQEEVLQHIRHSKRTGLWLRAGWGVTRKFEMLWGLLDDISDKDCRAIIFVERTAAAYLLLQLLNDAKPDLRVMTVTGKTSPTDRNQALGSLAGPGPCFLVATSALEEGIDVPEVNGVIRFDRFELVRQHIQGAGRARADNARIYYFENDPEQMIRKAAEMKELVSGAVASQGEWSPYLHTREDPVTGSVLNIFTAPDVLRACERCGLVFTIESDCMWCAFPGQPALDFAIWLSQFRMLEHDFLSLDPGRTQDWSNTDIRDRKLKFLMAEQLCNKGYICEYLLPSDRIPSCCRSLDGDADPLRNIPRAPSAVVGLNHKTKLNEWLMGVVRRPLRDGTDFCYHAKYQRGWKAVVAIVVWDWFGIFECQDEFPRKAAAEDDAAKIAFQSCSELVIRPWNPDVALGITAREALQLLPAESRDR
mmetsp:Transcript_91343/g.209304  ORF Transcript_91343/g.209304 Transcript_91343/m.209304 type:complete len:738 (-) Transcript_91343:94-2307(-)